MNPQQARRSVAYLRIGLGAMWLVPGLGASIFGLKPNENDGIKMMARLFAARDLVLGLALLQASEAEADRQVDLGIGLDLADLAAIVMAAMKKDVGATTLLLGGSTAAAAAGLGVMGRRVES